MPQGANDVYSEFEILFCNASCINVTSSSSSSTTTSTTATTVLLPPVFRNNKPEIRKPKCSRTHQYTAAILIGWLFLQRVSVTASTKRARKKHSLAVN